jgi:hypothetical protein
VADLEADLRDPDKWEPTRAGAIRALGAMGGASRDAVPAIRADLDSPYGYMREAASEALRRIESDR